MATHVMLDLETMSTSSYAAVIAIGAVKFDPALPFDVAVADKFEATISLTSAMKAGLRVDGSTVMWWLNEKRGGARERLLASEPIELDEALLGFTAWYGDDPEVPVWGNGATFDNVVLGNAFQACGLDKPWGYHADRCFRTLRALAPDVERVSWGQAHSALDDAIAQALWLTDIVDAKHLVLT